MKVIKKMLWILALAMIMLGVSSEVCAVPVQARQNVQVEKATKKKNMVAEIKVKNFKKRAKVRDGRKCTEYLVWKHLALEAYGVNAKGKKVKEAVVVQELKDGKFLYAKNGRIQLTLKCGNKTKRLYLTNVVQVKKVVANQNGVKLVENEKLTNAMVKKVGFKTTWENGRVVKQYKGAECLDIGKKITTKGKYFQVRFRVGNKIVQVKLPVVKAQKPSPKPTVEVEKQHTWGKWIPKDDKEDERQCSHCKKKEVQPHQFKGWRVEVEDNEDGTHIVKKIEMCVLCRKEYVTSERKEECRFETTYDEAETEGRHLKVEICTVCKYRRQEEEDCQYKDDWKYIGDGIEKKDCISCNRAVTREHVHEDAPEDLQYHCDVSNENGSHQLKAAYNCKICLSTVTLTKEENCSFTILYEASQTNGKHFKVRACTMCGYRQPEEESCSYNNWRYIGNNQDAKVCSQCKKQQTRTHVHENAPAELNYTCDEPSDGSGNHTLKAQYNCKLCLATVNVSKTEKCNMVVTYKETETESKHYKLQDCAICGYHAQEEEDCSYGEWKYIGNDQDARNCVHCNHQETRQHVHEGAPEGVQYVYKSSNRDGTHKLEATYTCSICSEEVILNQNEPCSFETSYERTGQNDIHLLVQTCTICQYRTEQDDACVPVGELKYQRRGSQIYEYYDCNLCGDWCKRAYHEHSHEGIPWECYDKYIHRKECLCGAGTEARIEEEHDRVYDQHTQIVSCSLCSYQSEPHNHGYGYEDIDEETGLKKNRNRSLMGLISSEAYTTGEILNKTQQEHPNKPSLEYCSRYDFRCKECGGEYHIYFDHQRGADGRCTRGYCDHMELPEDWVNPEKEPEF